MSARVLRLLVAIAVLFGLFGAFAPAAAAHAELRQASPRVESVVGGSFHSIALQFSGLAEDGYRAELLDPAGTSIGQPAVREKQRIVIPIEPLSVPGTYTVTYTVTGADGDITSDLFTFRFDPTAPEPEGITIEITTVAFLGWFGWLLLVAGAALLGWLVHRVLYAWRVSRAPATSVTPLADEHQSIG